MCKGPETRQLLRMKGPSLHVAGGQRQAWELTQARPGGGSGSFFQGQWEPLEAYEQARSLGTMG